MIYTHTPITPRIAGFWLLFSLFISTGYGIFFWAVFRDAPLVHHLLYSLSNGLIVPQFAGLAVLLSRNAPPSRRIWIIYPTCIIGAAVAVLGTFLLLRIPFSTDYLFMFSFTVNAANLSIIIGFLYYWERFADTKARIRQEQVRQLATEKTIVQNRMALIQAQLEPNFVFETLKRILELLATDLEKAKAMQLALIRYLRLSLSGFETDSTSIARELDVIDSYFDILAFLPGNRISCTMEVPDEVRKLAIPPMLIRAFVETIVAHQTVTEKDRVHLHIRANRQNGQLGFEFTGSGIRHSKDVTMKIGRIRQRIEKIFGDAGRLILEPSSGNSGVNAAIRIPATLPLAGPASR